MTVVWPKRNKVVHMGESATAADAMIGIETARVLLAEVVHPLAKRLGFTLETTGKWHKLRGAIGMTFEPKDPFQHAGA